MTKTATLIKRSFATAALMTFVCIGALAQKNESHIQPLLLKAPQTTIAALPAQQPRQPKNIRKAWSQTEQEMVLIDEDFSAFTEGSLEEPSTETLVSYYDAEKFYMDPSMTNQPGWWGDEVYQGGGAAIIKHRGGGYYQAVLNTPMGDYSGNLTIKLRYRNVGQQTAYLIVSIGKGGLNTQLASRDYFQGNVPVGDEWNELTLRYTNTCSDPDGLVQFGVAQGAVAIDDVKITSNYDFIAAPTGMSVVDYTDKNLTVAWNPVRKAADYRFYLYKQVFTSDGDQESTETFEDGLPKNWKFQGDAKVADGEGADGSKGLVLPDGAAFYLPNVGAFYNNVKFKVKLIAPEGADLSYGGMGLYLSTDGENFQNFGSFAAAYYNSEFTEEDMDMEFYYYGGFGGQYRSMGISAVGLPEGAYFVIDDVYLSTERTFDLVREGGGYYGYQSVNGTQFTAALSDPSAEYFYKVTAHIGLLESEGQVLHAAGLAAPVVTDPEDVDERGGYTATWLPSPKAQRYVVNNYGVNFILADQKDFVVLEESFDAIDASVTSATGMSDAEVIGNEGEEISLDDYTVLPGWTGSGNAMAQGMFGSQQATFAYTWLQTPALSLGNDDHFTMSIRLYGNPGYPVRIYFNGERADATFDANGVIDETYTVSLSSDQMVIRFTDDQYGGPFLLDYIKVTQDVKAGSTLYTQLGKATTTETEYRFSGLDAYDFNVYAYDVVAQYDFAGEAISSNPSEKMMLTLDGSEIMPTAIAPTDIVSLNVSGNASTRYNLAGQLISRQQSGLQIVKQADGSVRKMIRK